MSDYEEAKQLTMEDLFPEEMKQPADEDGLGDGWGDVEEMMRQIYEANEWEEDD